MTVKKQPRQKTDEPPPSKSAKRKARFTPTDSRRSKSRKTRSAPRVEPSKLLPHLLSADARELYRPKDERDVSATTKTYTGSVPMSPFEELVCAVVLSRPISHVLGQRTIRTIFNAPYNFTTPKAIKSAGEEKMHEALWEAKTQHKQKTAEQLANLAAKVASDFSDGDTDTSMGKLRKESEHDRDTLRENLTKGVKGVGKTGVDIFLRRVQGHWKEVYPFVDERTSGSLEKLGLPTQAEELVKALEENWKSIDQKSLQGSDEATKKRMAFVIILERAVACDLEGMVDTVSPERLDELSRAKNQNPPFQCGACFGDPNGKCELHRT